jgi:hypothetical protein
MSVHELFHVGVVVPDLDAARTRLTELVGAQWGPVLDNDIEIRDEHGNDRVVPNRICYSTEAPYFELIQEVSNTPWVCNEHSNLHHVGFFSDALAADSDGLRAAACPLEILDGHGSAPPARFAYHRDALGIRIELVSADLRELMEHYMFRPPDAPVAH